MAFTFDLLEIFEEAAEQAGYGELRTGYDFKTVRRSLALLTRTWANRGYNLYSIQEGELSLVQGTNTYELPADIIDVTDAALRSNAGTTSQFDLTLLRISTVDYYQSPYKLQQQQPNQFYVQRAETSNFVVWPTPDQAYTIVYWYMALPSDQTTGSQTMGLPERFIPALVSGLAHQLALKRPELAARVPLLREQADIQWQLASEEDRDRAPMRVVPYMGAIV